MHNIANALESPRLYAFDDGHRGFRYSHPDVRHFCVIKGVRAISAFNASVLLVRSGFTQEIAVLLRGLIECTTQIDYALSGFVTDGSQRSGPAKYVSAFFSDSLRGVGELPKKPKLRQEDIHKEIASEMARILEALPKESPEFDTKETMGRVYATFSNYVHARYPEVMDLYGGTPGKFHMRGMRGTPKDLENLETLEVYRTTLENCFAMMIHSLGLRPLVLEDPVTASWFNERHRIASRA